MTQEVHSRREPPLHPPSDLELLQGEVEANLMLTDLLDKARDRIEELEADRDVLRAELDYLRFRLEEYE